MHSSGWMNSICSPSKKHSMGQTTTQSVYLQPKQGSVTTIAIRHLRSNFHQAAEPGPFGREMASGARSRTADPPRSSISSGIACLHRQLRRPLHRLLAKLRPVSG